jgi:hypothetical protein
MCELQEQRQQPSDQAIRRSVNNASTGLTMSRWVRTP